MCGCVCVCGGGILSVYFMCAAAAAAGPGAQLAFCNRSSSSARARARRRSATWVAPKSETPRPDAPLAQARATSGPEPYRAQVQVAHACRAVPTVCHLPRCLRVIGGDGGQRRCRVGVDEALRRRRGACSGTEACLRRAPYHAVCIPYSSGVRRAACGVRRAACGVRRRRCTCSAHPADGMGGGEGRVPAEGREAATADAARDAEAHAAQDAQRRLHWTCDRGQAWG